MPERARARFVDDSLAHLLARASEVVSRQFHRSVREAGLSVAQWRILATLAGARGVPVKELAAIALMQQPTVTKLVGRMEAAGLVRRGSNATDRRQTLVFLAPRGAARLRSLLPGARAHEARILSARSPGEVARLKALLRSLIEMDQAPEDGSRSRSSSARLRSTPQR
jgi:DNA-binding MarR family transcriptional regulator